MTVLHVGFQKTGTTSIQWWLRDNELLLAEHGYRFPRAWLHLNTHVELSLTLTRLDRMTQGRLRGDEWRDVEWRTDVLEQIADDLASHRDLTTILSNEDLSLLRYDDELAALRALVGDAEIVAYLRNPRSYCASLAAHYCKPGMAGLSDDPEAFNYVRLDSWLMQYVDRLSVWRRHFTKLRVRWYDVEVERHGSIVPSFARLLGIPMEASMFSYWLQRRSDPVPRLPGNRALGLSFGQPASAHDGGKLVSTSMLGD